MLAVIPTLLLTFLSLTPRLSPGFGNEIFEWENELKGETLTLRRGRCGMGAELNHVWKFSHRKSDRSDGRLLQGQAERPQKKQTLDLGFLVSKQSQYISVD